MSSARPAVAVCRAKIACTVLDVLERVIMVVEDCLWLPQGYFCCVDMFPFENTSGSPDGFIESVMSMLSFITGGRASRYDGWLP